MDGRQIIAVRTCLRDAEKETFVPASLGIEVFVEKYSECDNGASSPWGGEAFMTALFSSQNPTFSWGSIYSSRSTSVREKGTLLTKSGLKVNISSKITAERANEFFAQLQSI